MSLHAKQVSALRLAIESLERERRERYAAGNAAYCQGVRTEIINSDGVTGCGGMWAEEDHKQYTRYTQAIQELDDLIDILTDPGVTYENNADLPMFAVSLVQKQETGL